VLQGSEPTRAELRAAARLLTVREVAERLRVSTATVYTLCKRGELAHVRIANSIRVNERVLAAYYSTV
jgi:excisionase family DNA binding protein